jgi:hypothetical protein
MNILGIDPGLKGALCLLSAPERRIIYLTPMPTIPYRSKLSLDVLGLKTILAQHPVSLVSTEYVHSRVGNSAPSIFSFGKNVGELHAVLKLQHIPMLETDPAAWKSILGVTADKETSKKKAHAFFPKHDFLTLRADYAEAALLAVFGAAYYRT